MRLETWQALVRDDPPVRGLSFVAFDTETTGFLSSDRLLEIAGVKFRNGRLLEEFSRLVDPGRPIPEGAAAVHGITNEMVQGQWSAREAIQGFFRFARDAVVMAHNAPFDAGILGGEFFRAGILPPEPPILDTLRMARRTLSCSNYSLEALVRELGLPREEHHRALPDARHVFRLFRRICREISPRGDLRLGEILERSGREVTIGSSAPEIPELPEPYEPLREASAHSAPVVILYEPLEGTAGYRTVTPRFFYRRNEVIYMEAYCHASGFERCYRLDRIREYRWSGP